MKKLAAFITASFTAILLFGQIDYCVPDPALADSTGGVYPPPYDATETPDGGITEHACINKPYQFTFTVIVGDSISLGILGTFAIDSIVLAQTGAIENLPAGLTYALHPESGVFPTGTRGCAVIYGTPGTTNTPGDYDLVINGTLHLIGSNGQPVALDVSFPNAALAPGKYTLVLEEESSTNCFVYTGIEESFSEFGQLNLFPNPVTEMLSIRFDADVTDDFTLALYDMRGVKIKTKQVAIRSGENNLTMNVENVMPGMYFLTISKGRLTNSWRVVIE